VTRDTDLFGRLKSGSASAPVHGFPSHGPGCGETNGNPLNNGYKSTKRLSPSEFIRIEGVRSDSVSALEKDLVLASGGVRDTELAPDDVQASIASYNKWEDK